MALLTNEISLETNLSNIIFYNLRASKNIPDGFITISSKSLRMLMLCSKKPMSKSDLFEELGITLQTNNVKLHLDPLVNLKLIKLVTEANVINKEKIFEITPKGLTLLNEIKNTTIDF